MVIPIRLIILIAFISVVRSGPCTFSANDFDLTLGLTEQALRTKLQTKFTQNFSNSYTSQNGVYTATTIGILLNFENSTIAIGSEKNPIFSIDKIKVDFSVNGTGKSSSGIFTETCNILGTYGEGSMSASLNIKVNSETPNGIETEYNNWSISLAPQSSVTGLCYFFGDNSAKLTAKLNDTEGDVFKATLENIKSSLKSAIDDVFINYDWDLEVGNDYSLSNETTNASIDGKSFKLEHKGIFLYDSEEKSTQCDDRTANVELEGSNLVQLAKKELITNYISLLPDNFKLFNLEAKDVDEPMKSEFKGKYINDLFPKTVDKFTKDVEFGYNLKLVKPTSITYDSNTGYNLMFESFLTIPIDGKEKRYLIKFFLIVKAQLQIVMTDNNLTMKYGDTLSFTDMEITNGSNLLKDDAPKEKIEILRKNLLDIYTSQIPILNKNMKDKGLAIRSQNFNSCTLKIEDSGDLRFAWSQKASRGSLLSFYLMNK